MKTLEETRASCTSDIRWLVKAGRIATAAAVCRLKHGLSYGDTFRLLLPFVFEPEEYEALLMCGGLDQKQLAERINAACRISLCAEAILQFVDYLPRPVCDDPLIWDREEINTWLACGAPHRDDWAAIKRGQKPPNREPTVIRAKPASEGTWRFLCEYCACYHEHAAHSGHQPAQCRMPWSLYRRCGYILALDDHPSEGD